LRRLTLISIDLVLVAAATILAVSLRGDFHAFEDKLVDLIPYICISIGCAAVVFLVSGLDRTPWRHTSVADHLQIVILTVLIILLALSITFAVNRLEDVSRTLPFLQAGLIISTLVSVRATARIWSTRKVYISGNSRANGHTHETVLVVGVNSLAELFILSVQEFSSEQIQVAGILSEEPKMRGRSIHQKPILGTVEELENILQSLEVHGMTVNRIVVATDRDRLLPRALDTLLEVEKSSNIVVQFISEQLGLKNSSQTPSILPGREGNIIDGKSSLTLVGDLDHVSFVHKSFWLKRILDAFGAALLMIILSPVIVLVALIVALDVGFPVIFWQQRPGLSGRPFKMYKFRTMLAPHDKHSRRIPDDSRSTAVGRILRYTRLDELPQLYNVLIGDMSFVGPRPLLPRDQCPKNAVRLSMRPGITGWAQVNGGRIIAGPDKWILDAWYVKHASLVLDLKIIFGTVKIILFGDRMNDEAVHQARSDLNLNDRTLSSDQVGISSGGLKRVLNGTRKLSAAAPTKTRSPPRRARSRSGLSTSGRP
jgi:lipopolysaccharide/colanic/teichoic acid biosynthesis glycosyltransferase